MNETTAADMLAFSNILSGLLASGHFTKHVTRYGEELVDLICYDNGKDWRDDAEESGASKRFEPIAVETAVSLFQEMKVKLAEING